MWQHYTDLVPKSASRLLLGQLGRLSVNPFLAKLSQFKSHQEQWLFNRIKLCQHTQFGQDHQFHLIKNLSDFKRQVPISNYDYFAHYINQVAAGKTYALIPDSEQLVQFTITTGSSGIPKLNPVTKTWLKEYQQGWAVWGLKLFNDHPRYIGSHILQMAGSWDMGKTAGGYQISMVSALLTRIQNPLLKPYYAVPVILNEVKDPVARHYAALRFALQRNIGWIMLMNPGTLIRLAEIGDTNKQDLIRDIHDGTLTTKFDIPTPIRTKLAGLGLKKNVALANKLTNIVERTGRLYPKDYWEQPVVGCWLGGTAGYQSRHLAQYFGNSPLRDMGLVSSEGRHTIPLEDTHPYGVPALGAGYYEFLPLNSNPATSQETISAHELEIDQEYRLIMTTSAGYYRFDIGDIVKCRGFVGEAPLLEFRQKADRIGDLEGEKLTEQQIQEAAHATATSLGIKLGLFSAIPLRLEHEQPRYDFIAEMLDKPDEQQSQRFLVQLDMELGKLNFLWKARRQEGVLTAPRLYFTTPGFFAQYQQQQVDSRGTGDYQYKHPGIIFKMSLEYDNLPSVSLHS